MASQRWSHDISKHMSERSFYKALVLYRRIRLEGIYDSSVVPLVLKACASLPFLDHAKALHAESIKTGSDSDIVVGTGLVDMYAKCGAVIESRKVFDVMPHKNVVTWNAMIGGFLRNGDTESATELFENMTEYTVVTWNEMINGFGRNGDSKTARRLFDKVPPDLKNVVTWTVMVNGYARNGEMEAAREVFEEMPLRNCFVWSSMISGYCKRGNVKEAKDIFNRTPVRNLEIWNSLISGFEQNGFSEEALEAFYKMQLDGFEPDEFTAVSALSACAQLGQLGAGKEVHHMISQYGIRINQFVLNGLVDMYAKCGDLASARSIFEEFTDKSISCWNAMISALATNGYCMEAVELFGKMQESKLRPDEITFLSVLSACSHGGLIEEAFNVVTQMETYGLQPGIKHYGCLVDLLGRADRTEEAYELMKRVSIKSNDTIRGTILGACCVHSDLNTAERVMEHATASNGKSAPGDESHYVLLSNIFARSDRWERAESLRRIMKNGGSIKTTGSSFLVSSSS